MKKYVVIFLVAAITMVFAATAAAQPASYSSGFQVANLSSTDATVVISYVNQDGSVDASINDTIPADGSVTYFPIDSSAGFNGSVVISSDQPVAAVANVVADNFFFNASYQSFDTGAPTVSLPLVVKDNFGIDSWFNVQNAAAPGGASVDVSVVYSGVSCDETATIEAGAAATFNQGTNTCLPDGYVGAATVTATGGDIVATVMQVNPDYLTAYNGFTSGSTAPVMPLVQGNNFGTFTGIQIQNAGTVSTDVTVTYTPNALGSVVASCDETQTIAGGSSATFALNSTCDGLDLANPNGESFVGSASVTANTASQPLAAIVNQTNFVNATSYNGMDNASATGTVIFPLVMAQNFGYFTGFNVYNAGASADVTCTFSNNTAGTFVPADVVVNLGAGESLSEVQVGAAYSDSYVGSATCSATGGSLLGVINQLGSGAGDQFLTSEGFNN